MKLRLVIQLQAAVFLSASLYTGTQAAWLSGKAWIAQQLHGRRATIRVRPSNPGNGQTSAQSPVYQ